MGFPLRGEINNTNFLFIFSTGYIERTEQGPFDLQQHVFTRR
jgi:hypothetical protein